MPHGDAWEQTGASPARCPRVGASVCSASVSRPWGGSGLDAWPRSWWPRNSGARPTAASRSGARPTDMASRTAPRRNAEQKPATCRTSWPASGSRGRHDEADAGSELASMRTTARGMRRVLKAARCTSPTASTAISSSSPPRPALAGRQPPDLDVLRRNGEPASSVARPLRRRPAVERYRQTGCSKSAGCRQTESARRGGPRLLRAGRQSAERTAGDGKRRPSARGPGDRADLDLGRQRKSLRLDVVGPPGDPAAAGDAQRRGQSRPRAGLQDRLARRAGPAVAAEGSMLKALAGTLVNEVMYDCVQFHGGMGVIRETRSADGARRARPGDRRRRHRGDARGDRQADALTAGGGSTAHRPTGSTGSTGCRRPWRSRASRASVTRVLA